MLVCPYVYSKKRFTPAFNKVYKVFFVGLLDCWICWIVGLLHCWIIGLSDGVGFVGLRVVGCCKLSNFFLIIGCCDALQ